MATDWAVVFATLVGPILAVWASDIRQARRQTRQLKEDVLFTLMSTRGNRQAQDHILALNRIEMVFPQGKHPKVADAWLMYHRHLFDISSLEHDEKAWTSKANDLFSEMIDTIAKELGFDFSMHSIRHAAYYPRGLINQANQSAELQELLVQGMRAYNASRVGSQARPVTPTQDPRANSGANPVRNERQ